MRGSFMKRILENSNEKQTLKTLARELNQLVEFSDDAIIAKNLLSIVTSWNPGAQKMFGYTAQEMIGKSLKRLIPPSRKTEEAMILKRILKGKSVAQLETVRQRKDGSLINVSVTILPLKDKNGRIIGTFKVARDISEQKKNEEHLRLLGGALEVAANAIVITDRHGVIQWVNKAFSIFSGYPAGEAIGKKIGALLKSGRHEPAFYRFIWETITAGNIWHGEIINRRKDGTIYTEDMTITPLRGERGKISHFIAVKLDITERKIKEKQLLRTQRLESLGTLAGGVAHDLNNILMPIMMCADALQSKLKDRQAREILSTISHSAARGAEMVSHVLSFARGIEAEKTAVRPFELIKDIRKIIQDTFPKNIRIAIDAPRELWAIPGDPTQLQQVLLNLCVNARDAMLGGGQLSIRARNCGPVSGQGGIETFHGPHVSIWIEDNGTGIPPALVDKIFDPFFTTKEIGKGSGLGLSTSLGIIQNHHGLLKVDSEYGKGSTFCLSLPAMKQKKRSNDRERKRRPARGKGETVLLVDDELCIRKTVGQNLKASGYRVITASNGQEALLRYSKNRKKINVIILDMVMPVMDGPETLRKLLKLNPSTPVIASSGVNFSTPGGTGKNIKAFLPKPYNSTLLLQTLRLVLEPVLKKTRPPIPALRRVSEADPASALSNPS